MAVNSGLIFSKYIFKVFINNLKYYKARIFTIIAILSMLFFLLGVVLKMHSLLIDQASRSNIGHIQLYNDGYTSIDSFSSKIENYKRVLYVLSMDAFLEDKVLDYSPQIKFTGIITNSITNKTAVISGLGISPSSSIKIGSYDITTLGSDLSEYDDQGIMVDDEVFKYLNLSYHSPVSIAIIDSAGELKFSPLVIRGRFKSELNLPNYNVIKIPLRTVMNLFGSDSVNHINILLKNAYDTNLVVNRINELSDKYSLGIKAFDYSKYSYHNDGKLNDLNLTCYFLCYFVMVILLIGATKIFFELYKKIIHDIDNLGVVDFFYFRLLIALVLLSFFMTILFSSSSMLLGGALLFLLKKTMLTKLFDFNSEGEMFSYLFDYDVFYIIPIFLMLGFLVIILILSIKYYMNYIFGVGYD